MSVLKDLEMARRIKSVTVCDLSRETGLAWETVVNCLGRKVRNAGHSPSIANVEKVAAALGVRLRAELPSLVD